MQIGGLLKLSLLDFPNKISCIVFTKGCNLACPFCHNADLVLKNKNTVLANTTDDKSITEDKIFEFLNKRREFLEGVCITGGEPLLQTDLAEFIKKIKTLGYKVKLDTNGCFPDRLKRLLDEKLLDYIAMDIKNSEIKYNLTAGANVNFADILKSAKTIIESGIAYEFRTTLVKELHTLGDIKDIGRQFAGRGRFYLQKFVDSGNIIKSGLSPFSDDQMQIMLLALQKYIPQAEIR